MSARESRPTGAASEAGELGSSIPRNRTTPPDSGKIGATVEKPMDATLWRLISGEIGLRDLTPALAGFYTLGFDAGRASLTTELDQACSDRDRYYNAAFNPRQPIKIGPSFAELERRRAENYGGAR